ncbi:MAG TPA: CoA pyrophosphatase [Jatrophihabitantaceae bacterium]|nr:CoA pyrophosphatase [Jatrophihabitantaceae bacterium]
MTDADFEPVAPESLPEWLRPLAMSARGVDAAALSAFLPPDDGSGRASAVLIALTETELGPSVLLIQRSAGLRNHAGQVAFPGGAVDPVDPTHVSAAVREAEEEVGLDPRSVRVIAVLPGLFIPPSGFVVTPVIAWWSDPHPVAPVDLAEVARVAIVPIDELCNPANRFTVTHPSGRWGPGFEAGGLFIWGFTALLLTHLLALGGWAVPWDEGRQRDLPEAYLGNWRRPTEPPPEAVPAPPDS